MDKLSHDVIMLFFFHIPWLKTSSYLLIYP